MNQKQLQPGSGVFTWSSLIYATLGSLTINLSVLQPQNTRKRWCLPGVLPRREVGDHACTSLGVLKPTTLVHSQLHQMHLMHPTCFNAAYHRWRNTSWLHGWWHTDVQTAFYDLTPSGMVMLLRPRLTMATLTDGKDTIKCRDMTVYWLNCLAILLIKGPWFGCGFYQCLYLQGCFATGGTITETPSNSSLLFDLKDWTHYLDMGSNQHVQVTSCQKGLSLFKSPQNLQVTALCDCTAGRCCPYRAMVQCDLCCSSLKKMNALFPSSIEKIFDGNQKFRA